jgi:hypothetical protein
MWEISVLESLPISFSNFTSPRTPARLQWGSRVQYQIYRTSVCNSRWPVNFEHFQGRGLDLCCISPSPGLTILKPQFLPSEKWGPSFILALKKGCVYSHVWPNLKTRGDDNITRNLVNGLMGTTFNKLFLMSVTYGITHCHLCMF